MRVGLTTLQTTDLYSQVTKNTTAFQVNYNIHKAMY